MNGTIITFYSYKGGTGRTMALANVACLLSQREYRVLVIDWDFEAPGLHRYFHDLFPSDAELIKTPGLIDLLWEYARKVSIPDSQRPKGEEAPILLAKAENYVRKLTLPDGKPIYFMGAGRQDQGYGDMVRNFNWDDFYERLSGGDFLDAFREWLKESFDYILIDSRTGISDTSGICTVQMPDQVVLCFTLNRQSIIGIAGVAQSIRSQREDLPFLPVAMRFEGNDIEDEAIKLARKHLDAFVPVGVVDIESFWEKSRVLYRTKYAFLEKVAALVEHQTSILMRADMLRLANNIDPHVVLPDWHLLLLESLLHRTGTLEIRGIGFEVGRQKDSGRYPIEQLYTTLRRGGESHQDLKSLLPRSPRLLIEGQPGAGKTTFLKLIAAMLAKDLLGLPAPEGGRSWRERYLGLPTKGAPKIPLFLRLSELAELLIKDVKPYLPDNRLRLLDLLAATTELPEGGRDHFIGLLERGEALLLLDGLDEVADEGLRSRFYTIVADAIRVWNKSPIVLTSRPVGVEQVKPLGFHHVVIEPFGKGEISEFISRWVSALHGESRSQLTEDLNEALQRAILERIDICRMAANPVMLTCLCVVYWNEGRLPEGRFRVFSAVIRWLISSRTEQRFGTGFTDQFAYEALADLALALMQGAKGKRVVFDIQDGAVAIEARIHRHFPELKTQPERLKRGREWLAFECLGSGIVEEVGYNRLKFWMLIFQEYLAAQALAWLGDGEGEEDFWPILEKRLEDPQWRETVELFPGALFDEGGGRRVDRLLQRILKQRGDNSDLAAEARLAGLLGRLLTSLGACHYKPLPEIEAKYAQVLHKALAIFTLEGAAQVPIKQRIEAAEALGKAGDPRLRVLTLIEVPGTGGWKLGKYPVTVMEFQRFVEQGGYQEPKCWGAVGWRLRQKWNWMEPGDWDQQLDHPNRPVTGVSWFEARAYCHWLSEQRGERFCLPAEAVWQQAATPANGMYPWGDAAPSPDRANYAIGKTRAPTPVGLFPSGDGPYGHCDLAGNVWEWQQDLHDEEMRPLGAIPVQTEVAEDAVCVLRGGAWGLPAEYLRSSYRVGAPAGFRDGNGGFRVALMLARG
ncbi:MAG: SUMF1/EgtB/PvdO family nonheme iron enzyme [Magnetococcales bacterium]|nr:SUMF1/EgtB/PvdO family nonheme iron enzyme [Magnetococcales bacterium]